MSWQERYGDKLVPVEDAVARVQSGDTVACAPFTCTPHTLCNGLISRGLAGKLRDVHIDHPASLSAWTQPGLEGVFTLRDNYATPPNRAACHAGSMEYLPIGAWKSWEVPSGFSETPDVFFVPVSPPNERGYCSFGPGVWLSGTLAHQSKLVIAEVHEDFIRTGGENHIHIDNLDYLVEATIPTGTLPPAPENPEETAVVEVIGTLVANELINNRDTIQLGVGTVSASIGLFLGEKEDLGVQTELITGGIAALVEKGVVTGRYKNVHRGKVVASALVALSREEQMKIHENPVFELYDFGYTDDLRRLIQVERFVTVNNALVVDLTGQVSAEAVDFRMYTGVGGQTTFMIAGAYSPGGKSVSVLPSSSIPSATGERVTRIVPVLAGGCPVTVPRTYVDYVVTEQGIATLRGKTQRERAREMVSISHPDFRHELAKQANAMFGPGTI